MHSIFWITPYNTLGLLFQFSHLKKSINMKPLELCQYLSRKEFSIIWYSIEFSLFLNVPSVSSLPPSTGHMWGAKHPTFHSQLDAGCLTAHAETSTQAKAAAASQCQPTSCMAPACLQFRNAYIRQEGNLGALMNFLSFPNCNWASQNHYLK